MVWLVMRYIYYLLQQIMHGDKMRLPITMKIVILLSAVFMAIGSVSVLANTLKGNATLKSGGTLLAWLPTTPYPLALHSSSCVAYNSHLYCVGGNSGSGANFSYHANAYYSNISNTGISTWTVANSYPVPINGESCVTESGNIYCIGGTTASNSTNLGYVATNAAYSGELSSNGISIWSATTPYPISVYAHSCVVDNSYVYCIGGTEGGSTAQTGTITDLTFYAKLAANGSIGLWKETTPYPFNITGGECDVVNNNVYCIRGTANDYPTYFAQLSSSGIGTWHSTTSYPINIEGGSCSTYGTDIICFGGFDGLPPSGYDNYVYYSTVRSNGMLTKWTELQSYPTAFGFSSCPIENGYVYCIAGWNGTANINSTNYANLSSI